MVAPKAFVHLLLLTLVVQLSVCTTYNTYHIFPICPEGTTCLTLSDAASENEIFFATNSTLILHPGDHNLHQRVSVANVTGLTIMSCGKCTGSNYSSARILCTGTDPSFSFFGVSDLHIMAISFISCKTEFCATQVDIHFSTFEDGISDFGGALAVHSGSTVHLSGVNMFVSNRARAIGGAIYIDASNLTMSGSTTFLGNTADTHGGAVYAENSTTIRFGGIATFLNNTAGVDGGAVATRYYNHLTFEGNTTFLSNTAAEYGGAVDAVAINSFTFKVNTAFLGNTVHLYGGAVDASYGNSFSFEGNTIFSDNTAGFDGGAVDASLSNHFTFEGNTTFLGNTADIHGGAVYAENSTTIRFGGITTFLNNTAGVDGGAVATRYYNHLTFEGNTTFLSNTAAEYGGAVDVVAINSFTFKVNTAFLGNTVHLYGGAVEASYGNSFSFEGNTIFSDNTAGVDGGAVDACDSNHFTFEGKTTFLGNTASQYGGAVLAGNSCSFIFVGDTTFLNNTAQYDGGAVYAGEHNTLTFNAPSINFHEDDISCAGGKIDGNNTFVGNTAETLGGAISLSTDNTMIVCGITSIVRNKAIFGGGIYVGRESRIFVGGSIEFSQNIAIFGGGIHVISGRVTMSAFPIGTFNDNCALGHLPCTVPTNINSESGFGGAIHAINSKISLNGRYLITNNTATNGGGFSLLSLEGSTLELHDNTSITFVGNTATGKGGAIHVEDNRFIYCTSGKDPIQIPCFFQTPNHVWEYTDLESLGNLSFINNTAAESGNTLYGGELDDCDTDYYYSDDRFVQGATVFQIFTNNDTSLDVSSDPFKVCICEDSMPQCDQRYRDYRRYPGQTLSLLVVAVGQMNGVVPSVIRAVPTGLNLTSEFITQPTVPRECTELRYPVLPNNAGGATALVLYSDEPCSTSGVGFTVNVEVLPCPTGFAMSEQQCICEVRLREYTQDCRIEDETVTRREGSTFWVGLSTSESGLILHPHCPFDYCTDKTTQFTLNETDSQCQEGRSGILCGACQSGYSLALGSSRCICNCPDLYLALVMAFVAAGIALVFLLLLSNLTVASGTLSGLIFYANILAINQSVFFPSSDPNFLTVFVAWLNLDLGIETCFCTSLDVYIRTWLQFAFPLYIWMLVGIIVLLAHFSTTIAKFMTNTNPVAVLATLFLLSYTKLLRAIMVAFSFTTLSYPGDKSKAVWLYDGNIEYGEVKLLILLLVSLLFLLVLFLPYTLLLLCGQWIQRHLQLKFLSSVKRLYLKAIFDAYYAPYKDRHRYWTGLLLVIRFLVLLLSTAVNIGSPQDPHTNLLVMIIILSGLLAWIGHGVYRKWYLDVLETSFLFNLIVLCAGTYQVRQSLGNQAALTYTSVSVAIVTFVMIVISAVMQRLRVPHYGKSFAQKMKSMKISNDTVTNDPHEEATEPPRASTVSTTVVDINSSQQSDSANYRETVVELM